jgi:molybdate transport system ATP-binding protein
MSDRVPFITVENVTLEVRGGGTYIPVRWEICSDEQWAVVGPNGSGKSSLMRAVCGQAPVAGGKIAYHFVENGTADSSSSRGALPQNQIAYVTFDSQKVVLGTESPYHQARWNRGLNQQTVSVSEYLSEHHVRRLNPFQVLDDQFARVDFGARREKAIQLLGLEGLLARDVGQVSNGERRKVLLARALLRNPRLLVLDNPFTGLDAGSRRRLKEIIGSLMEDEVRLVLVMNDRDEIPPGITHILLMGDRGVVAQGPRELVLDRIPVAMLRTGPVAVLRTGPAQWTREGEQPASSMRPAGGRQPDEARDPEDRVADSQVLVQMDNVSVSYDGVPILNQINWTVQQGENWALLGPNGAGKTTLLSLILGDNPHAYANNIMLFGKRRGSGESIWDIKRQIGWVAPELHLYYPKNVSCYDVVCSGFFSSIGRHRRCSMEQRDTVAWWLRHLGLSQVADMAFGSISEGEQRLILIARALVKCPKLLVLDEPCQGLDASNRDRVLQMVEAVGSPREPSIIYVTHLRDALPSVITHVLRLDEGSIVGEQKVKVRHNPASAGSCSPPPDPYWGSGSPPPDLAARN